MSGATDAIVYTGATSAGGASAASAVFGAIAATGGVVIAGAAVYMVARKMRSDYAAALDDYKTRSDRENAAFSLQNAAFASAQQRARDMALSLSPDAHGDPNTAFFLSGLGRLKAQLGGDGSDPAGPSNGAALLLQQCDDLLKRVTSGDASAQFTAYEQLSQAVAKLSSERSSRTGQSSREQMAQELVREQIAMLRGDMSDSLLAEKRHHRMYAALESRLYELEALAQKQPGTALQSLGLLRDRTRAEIRQAGENALVDAHNAARMRELVGEISAHAQAVLRQTILMEPRREAEALLKKVSALVAATPVELTELQELSNKSRVLFENTEKVLEEQAMAEHLEDQVAQVLGSLGYRVTAATNGQDEKKMVAVLDSGIGVQINVNGQGHLSGEMVAFSEATSEVSAAAQEKVCNLMDDIFDGLRRRNMVVREKKRKNLKAGVDKVPVVQVSVVKDTASVEVARPLEMSLGG